MGFTEVIQRLGQFLLCNKTTPCRWYQCKKKLHLVASSCKFPTVSVDDFEYKLSDFFSRVVGPARIIGPIFHLKKKQ
jgi:hypothetical protein